MTLLLACPHCATAHGADPDCELCGGAGHVLVDDGYVPCFRCNMHPAVAATLSDATSAERGQADAARWREGQKDAK